MPVSKRYVVRKASGGAFHLKYRCRARVPTLTPQLPCSSALETSSCSASQQIPGRPRGEARDGGSGCEDEDPGHPAEGTPSLLLRPQPELGSEWGRHGEAALSHLRDSANAGRLRPASLTHRAAMLAPRDCVTAPTLSMRGSTTPASPPTAASQLIRDHRYCDGQLRPPILASRDGVPFPLPGGRGLRLLGAPEGEEVEGEGSGGGASVGGARQEQPMGRKSTGGGAGGGRRWSGTWQLVQAGCCSLKPPTAFGLGNVGGPGR